MANPKSVKKPKKVQKDIDSILEKGVKYYEEENYDNAINCFSEIIEHDNENMYALFLRSDTYLNQGEIDNAINDSKKGIQISKNNDDEMSSVYFHFELGYCFFTKQHYDEAFDEFSKAIKIYFENKNFFKVNDDLRNPVSYSLGMRSLIYFSKNIFSKALKDMQEAIRINKKEKDWPKFRLRILLAQQQYKKVISESSILLKDDPRNMYLYYLNTLSLFEIEEEIEAKKVLEKALGYKPKIIGKNDDDLIENQHNFANQLFFLHICFYAEKYDLALKYANNFIKYYPYIASPYFTKSIVYLINGDEKKSIKNLEIFYQYKNKKAEFHISHSQFIAGLYAGMELNSEYIEENILSIFIAELSRYSTSVSFEIKVIFIIFGLDAKISEKRKFINVAKYFDSLYENFPNVEEVNQCESEFIKRIFNNYPVDKLSILDTLKKDGKERFRTIIKICFLSELLKKELENKKSNYSPQLFDIYSNLNKELLKKLRHTIEIKEEKNAQTKIEWERKVAQTKIDERDRIIRSQAHDIKNIISTIINPLMILKQTTKNPQIDRALKQAEVLSKMVNAVSLSYSGSEKDFYYDAKHNSAGMSLKDMITSSVEASIGNIMQIVKYYKPFWEQYFPQYDLYEKALAEYTSLHEETDNRSFGMLIKFLNKYMFDIAIEFGDSDALIIGDKKGSDVKLLTLFNEIIFNAIKYTAFVKKEDRVVSIKFNSSHEFKNLEVENSLSGNTEVKSVGTGNLIIDNIVNIMKGEVTRPKLNNRFITKIKFPNFWEEKNNGKDIVC